MSNKHKLVDLLKPFVIIFKLCGISIHLEADGKPQKKITTILSKLYLCFILAIVAVALLAMLFGFIWFGATAIVMRKMSQIGGNILFAFGIMHLSYAGLFTGCLSNIYAQAAMYKTALVTTTVNSHVSSIVWKKTRSTINWLLLALFIVVCLVILGWALQVSKAIDFLNTVIGPSFVLYNLPSLYISIHCCFAITIADYLKFDIDEIIEKMNGTKSPFRRTKMAQMSIYKFEQLQEFAKEFDRIFSPSLLFACFTNLVALPIMFNAAILKPSAIVAFGTINTINVFNFVISLITLKKLASVNLMKQKFAWLLLNRSTEAQDKDDHLTNVRVNQLLWVMEFIIKKDDDWFTIGFIPIDMTLITSVIQTLWSFCQFATEQKQVQLST